MIAFNKESKIHSALDTFFKQGMFTRGSNLFDIEPFFSGAEDVCQMKLDTGNVSAFDLICGAPLLILLVYLGHTETAKLFNSTEDLNLLKNYKDENGETLLEFANKNKVFHIQEYFKLVV